MKCLKIFLLFFFALSSFQTLDAMSHIGSYTTNRYVTLNVTVTDSIQPIISRKTIYYHIENRIDIYVPTASQITVNGDGLDKIDDYGHYSITTYKKNLDRYNLNIIATFSNGEVKNYKIILKIKMLGIPFIELNGKNGHQIIDPTELINASLSVSIKDPYFDNNFEILSFMISVDGMKAIKINGNKVNEEVANKILMSNNKKILFSNFQVIYNGSPMISFCKFKSLIIELEE